MKKELKAAHPEKSDDEGRLVADEAALTGRVKLSVYQYFIKNVGYMLSLTVLGLYMAEQVIRSASNIWLAQWSDANSPDENGNITTGN